MAKISLQFSADKKRFIDEANLFFTCVLVLVNAKSFAAIKLWLAHTNTERDSHRHTHIDMHTHTGSRTGADSDVIW